MGASEAEEAASLEEAQSCLVACQGEAFSFLEEVPSFLGEAGLSWEEGPFQEEAFLGAQASAVSSFPFQERQRLFLVLPSLQVLAIPWEPTGQLYPSVRLCLVQALQPLLRLF